MTAASQVIFWFRYPYSNVWRTPCNCKLCKRLIHVKRSNYFLSCSRKALATRVTINLIWVPDSSVNPGRVTITTPTLDRRRLCFRNFLKLYLYHIEYYKDKECKNIQCCSMSGWTWWCGVQVLTSTSQASFRLSGFWLSVRLCVAMKFISEFLWVNLSLNRLNQAKKPSFCTSPFTVMSTWVCTWLAHSSRTNQRPQKWHRLKTIRSCVYSGERTELVLISIS